MLAAIATTSAGAKEIRHDSGSLAETRMAAAALRILVVDDHAIVREAVARILAGARRPWTIMQAACGAQALELLRTHPVDVIVTDLSMPGLCGLELVSRLHADWPALRILVLSMHADGPLAAGALRAGALGYLAKERGGTELIDAVMAVAEGHSYLSQDITERAVAQCRDPAGGLARLSGREYEIFRRIVQGFGTSSIAQELQLSVKTVSTYKRRILDKLALDSTAALVSLGVRSGVVDQADTTSLSRPARLGS